MMDVHHGLFADKITYDQNKKQINYDNAFSQDL